MSINSPTKFEFKILDFKLQMKEIGKKENKKKKEKEKLCAWAASAPFRPTLLLSAPAQAKLSADMWAPRSSSAPHHAALPGGALRSAGRRAYRLFYRSRFPGDRWDQLGGTFLRGRGRGAKPDSAPISARGARTPQPNTPWDYIALRRGA